MISTLLGDVTEGTTILKEGTLQMSVFIGRVNETSPQLMGGNHSSFDISQELNSPSEDSYAIGRTSSPILPVVSSVLVAVCRISCQRHRRHGISGTNVRIIHGLIILPIVGNCAGHTTAMTVIAKNNLGLAIGASVGSSIQIALFGLHWLCLRATLWTGI